MRRALFVLLLAMLSVPAAAQTSSPWGTDDRWWRIPESRLFVAGSMTYLVFAGLDAGITRQCILAGTCVEVNPTLVPLVERWGPTSAMAVKVGVNAGIVLGLHYVDHRWPDKRHLTRKLPWVLAAVQGSVVLWNLQQLNGGGK